MSGLHQFFSSTPPQSAFEGDLSLDEFLHTQCGTVLVVSDRGTSGLGGPTRADVQTGKESNFVDFVRNIGRDAAKAIGGGTYGFGKGILWSSSTCRTVLVYSRAQGEQGLESRLIGVTLSGSYTQGGKRYTGRHWWGVADPATGAEPFVESEADEWAERVGFLPFEAGETGTSLMVLGPVQDEDASSLADIVESIRDAILWWCWPHAVDGTIRVVVTHEGKSVAVPDPRHHPIVGVYCEAYERATGDEPVGWPWYRTAIAGRRGLGSLGTLAWRAKRRVGSSGGWVPEGGAECHVALMRRPRFIVKYRAVEPLPDGSGNLGVFVADDERDADFAAAEPVAHDDWSPAVMGVAKGEQNAVRVAFRRMTEEIADAVRAAAPPSREAEHSSVVNQLAGALGSHIGLGVDASSQPLTSGSARSATGGPRSPRQLSVDPAGSLKLIDGVMAAEFTLIVRSASEGDAVVVTPRFVLDGGGVDKQVTPSLVGVVLNGSRVESGQWSRLEVPEGDSVVTVEVGTMPLRGVTIEAGWC
ncbi:hypothetical protein [Kytococcus aerolatus]|nr:hypothetical protein [Kytococcus aerolatus]